MLTTVLLDTLFMIVVRQVVMYCAELLFKKFWSKTSQKRRALKKKLTYIMPNYYQNGSASADKLVTGRNTTPFCCRAHDSTPGASTESGGLWQPRHVLLMGCLSLIYLSVSCLLIGFKVDQILLMAFISLNYFASHRSRRFITAYSVFVVYWILFDYMKAFPNYQFATVNIASLYQLEKRLFGITAVDNHTVLTPNEYLAEHGGQLLDIVAGLFYLCWIPVPLLFAIYLLYGHSVRQYLNFSLTFLLVNVIGFTIYYACPAAPPWYVQTNGFEFVATTPGSASRLANFDAYVGVDVFKAIYAKSSNVFAALPSLHSAYPVVVLYYGLKVGLPWPTNTAFATIMCGIWFSAVYSGQHYILDVLAGFLCACVGIVAYNKLLLIRPVHRLIHKHFYHCIIGSHQRYANGACNYDSDDREKFDVIVYGNEEHTRTV